jgi:hypothetical protein
MYVYIRHLRPPIIYTFILSLHWLQALTWSFFRLASLPDVQQKVFDEISVLLEKSDSPCVSYEDLNGMKYLDAFCMEVSVLA